MGVSHRENRYVTFRHLSARFLNVCVMYSAYENRIREQKLRMEIAQAKKENTNFLERLDRSKAIEKIKNRKVAQKGKEDRTVERFFRQNLPADERK